MKNLKREDGVIRRGVDGHGKALVPYRLSRSTVVRHGGKSAFRINPEDCVGFEVPVTPVDIFEMLSGDYGDVEVKKLRRRRRRWLNS